jgi:hypothetical protein
MSEAQKAAEAYILNGWPPETVREQRDALLQYEHMAMLGFEAGWCQGIARLVHEAREAPAPHYDELSDKIDVAWLERIAGEIAK